LRDVASAGLSRAEATRIMRSLNAADRALRPERPLAPSLLRKE